LHTSGEMPEEFGIHQVSDLRPPQGLTGDSPKNQTGVRRRLLEGGASLRRSGMALLFEGSFGPALKANVPH
jgi:hypothetical protein